MTRRQGWYLTAILVVGVAGATGLGISGRPMAAIVLLSLVMAVFVYTPESK